MPDYWGLDGRGRPANDPAAIAGHKGFGLALLVEILTGVLAETPAIDEKPPCPATGGIGPFSQAALVIRPSSLLGPDGFARRNAEMLTRFLAADPGIQIPGRRSAETKVTLLRQGWIELEEWLPAELDAWAEKPGAGKVTGD